jgi:class 3 adenylate cyclase/tetratricopeptide (TPR) repeat protein
MERKVVTALFCDIAGSTALGEQLDPEALHSILSRYFESIAAIVERHGGTVQKYAGDAVLAVFGIPRVREDDALRAVRTAVEIHQQLPDMTADLGVTLTSRTGINTGLVVTDEGRTLALGDAVNVAARLEQAAQPGEILLGDETLQLVRDAVEVEPLDPLSLKGKSELVPAFRLVSADPIAPGLVRRLDVPLVDREAELQQMLAVSGRAIDQRRCELITLLGTAGVGKSRLVEELCERLEGNAMMLRGRCLPYGEGITFWPLSEALAAAGPRAEPVISHLTSGGAATREELFLEVRRLLESLAETQPVILHVDDLHWGEPMLIELLDHVVALSSGAPILVLCTARGELLEDEPTWGTGRPNATSVRLEPLGSDDCEQLLDQLGGELEPDVRASVIRTSEGNPLFLHEMAVLARERGTAEVPPTIQALLAARLERLDEAERRLLERGSVEGEVFHASAVHALADDQSARDIDARLEALVAKDLIRSHPPNVAGDKAFRFRHLLIRDAAYERLPKAMRAALHERYAQWMEAAPVDFVEVDEIAGWHLEQATQHARAVRREVDPGVSRRGAERLFTAGRRASDRSDVAAARNLFERALALVEDRDPMQAEIAAALAERLIEVGDLHRAGELLALAERDGTGSPAAALSRLEWLVYSQPDEGMKLVESRLPRMLDEFAASGDERALAKAHWLAFWVQWAASRATEAGTQARLAARHALAAGDRGLWSRALGWYVATLIYGPANGATIAAELDAIEREQPGPYLAACTELGRAEVERLEGRFDQANAFATSARERFSGLGMRTMTATCDQALASIEFSRGDAAGALDTLLRSDALLAEFGEQAMRSTTQAMLGRAHELVGGRDRAAAALDLAEQLSAPTDLANFAITHEVRARLELHTGDSAAAERLAREAVQHAGKTDFVGVQAQARLGLAQVLSGSGRYDDARAEARAAVELFEAKGDRPGAGSARQLLAAPPART